MKLSYSDPETEKLKKKQLIEYVIGVKPETKIGKVMVDGLFPASQFHFSVDDVVDPNKEELLYEALKLPFCGMVDIKILTKRIIITTTCPAKEREKWAQEFVKKINEVLDS